MSNDPSYNEREAARSSNHPMFHSSGCLEARVDSFCDDTPDPGCTCGREAALRTGCKNCDEPRCNGHDCPNAPRVIPAWKIATGDLIGGRIVEEAAIHERNEWLTVHVAFADGSPAEYSYYQALEVH